MPEGSAVARACGGTNEVANLRVRCRAHNRLHAERTFGKEHVEGKIRERPRQRGSTAESCVLAASGLVNMGFRHADVRRALVAISARHRSEPLGEIPVETIVREALAALTQPRRGDALDALRRARRSSTRRTQASSRTAVP